MRRSSKARAMSRKDRTAQPNQAREQTTPAVPSVHHDNATSQERSRRRIVRSIAPSVLSNKAGRRTIRHHIARQASTTSITRTRTPPPHAAARPIGNTIRQASRQPQRTKREHRSRTTGTADRGEGQDKQAAASDDPMMTTPHHDDGHEPRRPTRRTPSRQAGRTTTRRNPKQAAPQGRQDPGLCFHLHR